MAEPDRAGFGSVVISAAVEMNINGSVTVDYAPAGFSWKLTCPAGSLLEGGPEQTREPPFAVESQRSHVGRRVLIVEDEPIIASDMASTLAAAGFDVVGPAGDVARALALIERPGCDAAVLDVNLRSGTSEFLARKLASARTPFVVVTGYSIAQLPHAFQGAPLLTKSLKQHALEATVKECIEGASAR